MSEDRFSHTLRYSAVPPIDGLGDRQFATEETEPEGDAMQPQQPSTEAGLEGDQEQLPGTKPRPDHPALPEEETQDPSINAPGSGQPKLGSNPFDGLEDTIQMATAVEPPGEQQLPPTLEAAVEELHEAEALQSCTPEEEPLPERPKAVVCPYLGTTEDAKKGALGPDSMRSCYAARHRRPVPVSYQVRYCLSTQHTACDTYRAAQDGTPIETAADRSGRKGLVAFFLRLFGLK